MSQTGCEQYQVRLAAYRDLSPSEWEALLRHLEGCPACARTRAAYQHQDLALGRLSRRIPSASLAARVWAQTTDRRKASPGRARRWALVAAMGVVITLATLGGAAGASAESLPGDFLYPVKRAAEQVQYALKPDPVSREQYREALLERRRDEVDQVTQLEREVEINFEGRLAGAEGNSWTIGGLTVQVPEGVWEDGAPQSGELLQVKAKVQGGKLVVERIRVRATQQPRTPARGTQPTAEATPQSAVSQPSATLQGEGESERLFATSTVQASSMESPATPSGTLDGAELGDPSSTPRMASPEVAPHEIAPHERDPHRTKAVTPNAGALDRSPTETPRTIAPRRTETQTPRTIPPGRRHSPTSTPRTVTPRHSPTSTPKTVTPRHPPTSRPRTITPRRSPTSTPSTGGHGRPFTATPPGAGPTRWLSATPTASPSVVAPSPTVRPTRDHPHSPRSRPSPTPTSEGSTSPLSPTPGSDETQPLPTATPKGQHGHDTPRSEPTRRPGRHRDQPRR